MGADLAEAPSMPVCIGREAWKEAVAHGLPDNGRARMMLSTAPYGATWMLVPPSGKLWVVDATTCKLIRSLQ
ncbi:MAG: hypothetical protein WKG00_07915 [Polyangiaceae bacterium]